MKLFPKPPFSSKTVGFDSKEKGRYHIQDSATSHNHIKLSSWNTALHDFVTASLIPAVTDTQPQWLNSPLQGSCGALERNNKNSLGNRSPPGRQALPSNLTANPPLKLIMFILPTLYRLFSLDESTPLFLERSLPLKWNPRLQTSEHHSFINYSYPKAKNLASDKKRSCHNNLQAGIGFLNQGI